jgi:peptidoglycan/xylan/chitin deacetylase (PgdA/CDA1 family)
MPGPTTIRPDAWPASKPVAVSVNVMLEGYADDQPPGIGPVANPLKPGTIDLQAQSWALYGPKVGAWRLLDLFERTGTRALFYTSGILAERFPDLVAAIGTQGHALGAHGYIQSTIPAYQTRDEEAADLGRCIEAITAAAGRCPTGWLSPRCTPSVNTTSLVAGAGMSFHADMFDSDLPYLIATEHGPIVGIPFTTEINDLPLLIRYGNEPQAFSRILGRLLDNWKRLGSPEMCLDITVHAHVFGRPAGAVELLEALDIVRAHEFCWLTTHEDLARIYAP